MTGNKARALREGFSHSSPGRVAAAGKMGRTGYLAKAAQTFTHTEAKAKATILSLKRWIHLLNHSIKIFFYIKCL